MPLSQTTYEIIRSVIDVCGLFLDTILILFLADNYFPLRNPNLRKKPWLFYLISFVFLCAFIYFVGFSKPFSLFVFSIFAAIFCYLFCLYRGSLIMKLSVCCVYCSLYFAMDGIYLSFYRYLTLSLDEIPHILSLFVFFIQRVFCKVLMYFIIRFILKNAVDIDHSIPRVYSTCLVIFCIFDALLMVLNIAYFSPMESQIKASPFISLFMAGAFGIILCFFYLFTSMIRNYKENIGYRLQVKELELHRQYLEQTRDLLTASRQFRHDMKSHLFCMEGLIEQGKYEELKSYLKQFSNSDFLTFPFQAICADESLNTLLNQKLKAASNLDIPMTIDVQISNHLAVSKLDLCTVLSNLCDNAIEASASVSDPKIIVSLKEIKGYLSLTVKNHTEEDILEKNPSLLTTKKDQSAHGLGMTIIRNIAAKYHGSVNLSSDMHSFTCFVLLENIPKSGKTKPAVLS